MTEQIHHVPVLCVVLFLIILEGLVTRTILEACRKKSIVQILSSVWHVMMTAINEHESQTKMDSAVNLEW